MPLHMPAAVRFAHLAVAVLLLAAAQSVAAQSSTGLTVALVDQRIAVLRGGGTPSDNATLTTYEQARAFLNEADSFAREATTYAESLTSAPQREAEIQRRLDERDEAYDPAREIEGLAAGELTARLARASAQQRELQSQRQTLDRRLAATEINATSIPARLDEIDRRLGALPEGDLALDATAQPSLAEANQWRRAAEAAALVAERRAEEAQLMSDPARHSAMMAERAELVLQLQQLTALIRELETRLTSAAQAVAESTEIAIEPTDPAYAIAAGLAARNADLGRELASANERVAGVRAQNDEIARNSRALDERSATAKRIVEYDSSEALGEVLLRYRAELANYDVADPTERLSREMGRAIIRRINYEEALTGLVSASGFVNRQLRDAGLEPESIAGGTRATLLDLTQTYRDRLRAVMAVEPEYIAALGELERGYTALSARLEQYRHFLEARILWIPNRPPLWTVEPGTIVAAWEHFVQNVSTIRLAPDVDLALAVIAVLAIVGCRRRILALQNASNNAVGRPHEDSIAQSALALGAAALRAAPVPLLLLGLAGTIDIAASAEGEGLRALLSNLALVLFAFSLMRVVSEPDGIGRIHFGWRSATMDRVHGQLTFLIRAWLPVAFATALVNRLAPFAEGATLSRLPMVAAMLMLTLYFGWDHVREIRRVGQAWFGIPYNRLRALLVVVFFALTVAIVYGQSFTVTVMAGCLVNSAYVGILLLLVHALITRSLKVTRWRLRLKELEAERAARASASEDSGTVQEEVADVGHVSAATAQLVNVATIAVAAAAVLYIWEPLLPALAAFDRVELWTSTSVVQGETVVNRITLATVLNVLILAGLTVFAAKRLPAVIEIVLRSRSNVSAGTRYATSALLNYVIVGVGIVAALSALGTQVEPTAVARCRARCRHRLRPSGNRGQFHQRHHHSVRAPDSRRRHRHGRRQGGYGHEDPHSRDHHTRLGRQGAARAEQGVHHRQAPELDAVRYADARRHQGRNRVRQQRGAGAPDSPRRGERASENAAGAAASHRVRELRRQCARAVGALFPRLGRAAADGHDRAAHGDQQRVPGSRYRDRVSAARCSPGYGRADTNRYRADAGGGEPRADRAALKERSRSLTFERRSRCDGAVPCRRDADAPRARARRSRPTANTC